ncbi:MAG: NUDIX hydrolase [Chlamydiae bacterium]|nr:NUDIX hydrolase [Chlamydiota bacterium]
MQKIPKVKSSRVLHKGFITLNEDLLEKDGGATQTLTTISHQSDSVVILAKDQMGRWILNREYRHSTKQFLLGCPGGTLEYGEGPIAGGQRELFEETGYFADDIILLGSSYSCPAISSQKTYHLFAQNAVKKATANLDPFEFIETELLDEVALKKIIQEGSPIDGVLLTALWFKEHLS